MAGSGFNYPSNWNVYNFSDPNGSILNTTDSGSVVEWMKNMASKYGANGITGSTGYGIGNAINLSNPVTDTSSFASWMKSLQSNPADSENNVASNVYDQGFLGSNSMKNVLGAVGLGLGALSGIGSYLNGKKYMSMLKDQMAQQNAQFNETYNNKLKEYNTALADRLRARAAFETGNSSAYNDEITNNSLSRGQTGNANSSYLNYKRSENAV